MAREGRAVAKASILMALNSKNFNKQVKQTQKAWTDFAKKIQTINEQSFGNSKFGQKLSEGVAKLAAPVSKVMPMLNAVGSALSNIARLAAGAGAAIGGALAGGVAMAVREAAALENETAQLNHIFGELDTKKLKDFVMQVQPFMSASRDVVFQSASVLGMVGYSERDVETLVQAMADVGAVSGDADKGLQNFSAAFRKMAMTGKLDSRTVNMFLKENVNMYQLIAQQMGMTLGEAQDAVSKGMISAATAQQVFLNYASQFYGATQEQSNTLSGSFETVQQLFKNLLATLGDAETDRIKEFLGSVQDFLVYAIENAPNLSAMIADLIDRVLQQAPAVLDFLHRTVNLLGSVADWISSIGEAFYKIFTGQMFTREGFAEFDQNNQKRWQRITGGDWLGTSAQQFLGGSVNDYLSRYGFSPEQIAAGMAKAKSERLDSTQLAKDVHKLAQASSMAAIDRVPVSAFGGAE